VGGHYKITGILKDIPENTTFQFDFLTSTVSPYFLERKLPDFMERHMGAEVRALNTYHLQPFNRIYLYSNADYGISFYGDINQIYTKYCHLS
jgi:hypothetical protein